MNTKKKFIADFHIHSHYSIATSKYLVPEYLDLWAKIKGIKLIGTGDFTHPRWLDELEEKLIPSSEGLYKLKNEYKNKSDIIINNPDEETHFILTAEVSSIYKKNDRVRKTHNVLFAPDFGTVRKIQMQLSKIGNIHSDGRPILGLDAKNLLEIILNTDERCFLVPAHIWTPWFSVLGSKSGFDSIGECFEDLTEYIFAIETGLSSDPPMNWSCSFLDDFAVISNSDAHSPENLGREANIFNTELSYSAIKNALKNKNKDEFLGTIEFYPQEGKYHYDGHRKCNVRLNPIDSIKNNNLCPVCKKPLTLGVMYRVAQLSDRPQGFDSKNKNNFYSLIPLTEIISEILGVNKSSKKVKEAYNKLIRQFGSEFNILLTENYDGLLKSDYPVLSEAVKRMHQKKVFIEEGYDGEYGIIKVFKPDELKKIIHKDLFISSVNEKIEAHGNLPTSDMDFTAFKNQMNYNIALTERPKKEKEAEELNESQKKAVQYIKGPAIILAGPGTGKTKTLTFKIMELLKSGIDPENILNLTFSNQAALEIKERIKKYLNDENISKKLNVSTFHAFGLSVIEQNIELAGRNKNYNIIETKEKEFILKNFLNISKGKIKRTVDQLSKIKQAVEEPENEEMISIFLKYEEALKEYNLLDFDDLLFIPLNIFCSQPEILKSCIEKYRWVNVDEFQDLNLIQYKILRKLCPHEDSNLTVIGDPNQAIYGFRGASAKFINEFLKDYKNASAFSLDTSYRCPDNILKASSQIINAEKHYLIKGIEEGLKINIKEYDTDKTEAEFIARKIENMIGGLRFFSIDSGITDGDRANMTFKDFAVLLRTGRQMDVIINAFNDHSIPYEIIGEIPYYRTSPFNEIIEIIKCSLNPENSFYKKAIEIHNISSQNLGTVQNLLSGNKIYEASLFIFQNYFPDQLEKNSYNLKLLEESCNNFKEAADFVRFTESGESTDQLKSKSERVKLMTMHASKGLEFDTVFIAGCSEVFIPFSLYQNLQVDMNEEQRLLYVAMTRARKNLYLTYSKKSSLSNIPKLFKISPFVEKIQKELIKFEVKEKKYKKADDEQLLLF
ncbi:MAG: UvrD-helicase domain-containing protein [Spirochaetes bacterium]|nr:UvrD-helicase domain-containing protein [Spirochaetota bacterium]